MVTKESIKQFFDKEARGYDIDVLEGNLGKRYVNEIEKNIIEREVKNVKNILDVGIGTGRFSKILIDKNITVTGLDISEEMLKAAEEKLGEKVELFLGDAENIPFNDNSFDGIVCMRVFKYFKNHEKALREFNRICKKNGLVIFGAANSISYQSVINFISKIFYKVGIKRQYSSSLNLISLRKLKKLLNENDFRVIKIEKNIKLPYFIYGFINSKAFLRFLVLSERLLDKISPRLFLARDFIVICVKN